MSIHMLCGKPGAGKSLYMVREMVKEVLTGSRPIVTNLDINWEGLQAYCEKQGYPPEFDVRDRVTILEGPDLKEFYLCRGMQTVVGSDGAKQRMLKFLNPKRGEVKRELREGERAPVLEFDTKDITDKGVMYCLDEVWMIFPARKFSETSEGVEFYVRQHRKLGDTVLMTTHSPKDVDTIVRRCSQDFTWLVNWRKRKVMTIFKALPVFGRKVYAEESPGPNSEPMVFDTFTLDAKGIGNCYYTESGIGVKGGSQADKLEKAKGVPVWALPLGLACVGILGYFGVMWVMKRFAYQATSMGAGAVATGRATLQGVVGSPPAVEPAVYHVPEVRSGPAVTTPPDPPPDRAQWERSKPKRVIAEDVYITGIVHFDPDVWVTLSDGRVITQHDKRLQAVGDDGIVYAGEVVRFKPKGVVPANSLPNYSANSVPNGQTIFMPSGQTKFVPNVGTQRK